MTFWILLLILAVLYGVLILYCGVNLEKDHQESLREHKRYMESLRDDGTADS